MKPKIYEQKFEKCSALLHEHAKRLKKPTRHRYMKQYVECMKKLQKEYISSCC